ncbi:hypothetical protein Leryth_014433 [Lithospermum erythrorhizon]|nr:hypothetical protein Leryth_014433 [Lithospermum erythrorhizon]
MLLLQQHAHFSSSQSITQYLLVLYYYLMFVYWCLTNLLQRLQKFLHVAFISWLCCSCC